MNNYKYYDYLYRNNMNMNNQNLFNQGMNSMGNDFMKQPLNTGMSNSGNSIFPPGPGGVNVDDFLKKLDAQIAALEEEERQLNASKTQENKKEEVLNPITQDANKDKDLIDLKYNKIKVDQKFIDKIKEDNQKYKKNICLVSNTKTTKINIFCVL